MAEHNIHRVTVWYEDTDFSGVVYYANYLRYFEQGRDVYFGIDELMRMYRETGIGFAVYKAEIHYREGARFGDRLEVRTYVKQESEYRIVCDQSAWKEGGSQPLVKATIQMVCVNGEQKLVPIPQWVVQRLAERDEVGT